jgi:hypothetical protein
VQICEKLQLAAAPALTFALQPSFWPSMLTVATSASASPARALPVYQDAGGSSWILNQDLCQSAK